MRIFIMTDLEGISGVDSIDMMGKDPAGYEKARKYLMLDTNAAIRGAFDGGADEVAVFDGHGSGENFIKEELDPRARRLTIDEYFRTPVKDFGFDGFISVGCHAMAGTVNAFLDHTQSSTAWFDFKINGESHGEIGQQAALFGIADIPLLMVSGDEAACREATKLIPEAVTACTKTAVGRNYANCIPVEESTRIIYEAARTGVQKLGSVKPYKIALPVTLDLTFTRNDYCDDAMRRDPLLIRNGRQVTRHLDTVSCALDTDWF